jgi:NitT/TauT family transport system ATP-binding protein
VTAPLTGPVATDDGNSLVVRGVSKWFPQREAEPTHVLDDVAFRVEGGQFVSIVGASGCGKTTLLRIIDGLETADSGTVEIGSRKVTGPGLDRGFVFQQDSLYPWRTVEQNVWLGLEAQGRAPAERRETARGLIDLVGLREFGRHYPHELSGGMRQRVNLARALAIDPQVLLMDEPFAALDAQTREVMQLELLRVWNDRRKTVLFITHQIDEAVYLGDRVIVMSARPGRVRADLRIDLPRPRDLRLKRTPEFVRYTEEIWDMIEREVLVAASAERGTR